MSILFTYYLHGKLFSSTILSNDLLKKVEEDQSWFRFLPMISAKDQKKAATKKKKKES